MRSIFLSRWALVLCVAAGFVYSADIYVSPTGDDAAAGTISAPLKTIAAARDAADKVKASGPVTVYLRGGTYYLSAPVAFSSANSGTAAAPITYTSYAGENAVISGGINVTGATWTTSSGSIMKTTIATNLKVDQLFCNGKRQIMARYPNFTKESDVLQGNASDALTKAGAAANPAEGPGYIRGIHNQGWGGEDYIITGKSGSSVAYTWVGDNNRGSTMGSKMVENIYELLDVAGEWFYRKTTGELFFWPPSGTSLSTSTVIELASQNDLLRFVGSSASSANSVKYITFNNVTFTHTYRTLFSGTYELVFKSDWGIVRDGAVFMQNAENITIKNCLFDQIGGNGVFFSGYNQYNVVQNCDFEYAGANCVCLFGLHGSVRCPNSWSGTVSCSDVAPGPLTNEYPSHCRIDNNMMNMLGRFEKQVSGVALSATEFDTVRHNSIHDMPRAGINFCDGCWGGHLVDYNWVYNVVQETSDHGPFNAWGRDRNEIAGQSNVAASLYDARNPTNVIQNRFESPNMFGIDLDDQASNYYQEKNLIIGAGFKVQWTRYNKYINNISITSSGNGNVQFHGTWGPNSNHYGARNIIYGSSTCVYQFCCGSNPTQVAGTGTKWDSNMVYSTAGTPNCSDWNGCGSGNYTWANWQAAGLDVHSTVANPTWTNTSQTWPNYLPKGNYNPTNTTAINAIKFQTFAMDSFGVMGPVGTAVQTPFITKKQEALLDSKPFLFHYNTNRLSVSFDGSYKLTIMSLSGKTVATFNGKGNSEFVLNSQRLRSGIYFAVIHTASNAVATRQFVVSL